MRKHKGLGILVGILIAVAMLVVPFSTALAATSQNVDVYATPAFIGISNSPGNWTLDGITGDGKVAVNTFYYANPLGDLTAPAVALVVNGECRFTLTNTSSVDIDLSVNCSDFASITGGMTNSNLGTNGATTYGAYSWYSGGLYASKVIMKSSASALLYNEFPSGNATFKWGAEIKTRTDAWADATMGNATMTITGVED